MKRFFCGVYAVAAAWFLTWVFSGPSPANDLIPQQTALEVISMFSIALTGIVAFIYGIVGDA